MSKKKNYFERYKEEQKEEKKINDLKKKYHLSEEKTVILENRSIFEKVLLFIFNIIKIVIKAVIYIAIFILSTIGATVLMNESLREPFFELIKTIF